MSNHNRQVDNDLIPYACHVDNHTIITKNGCLLQTISFNRNVSDHESFRIAIRNFITYHYSQNIAIYLHTTKLEDGSPNQTVSNDLRFEDVILGKIAALYNFAASSQISYNITFVTKIFNKDSEDFNFIFSPNAMYQRHQRQMQKAKNRLHEITELAMQELKEFAPSKLSIIKNNNVYKSEHLNFLAQLINLQHLDMPLPIAGMCYSSNISKHKFGKNKFSVKTDTTTRYATIFGVKEYSEISVDAVYSILQAIPNIIICQAILPVNNKSLLKEYQTIAEIYSASTDEEFKSSSALEYMNKLISSQGGENIYAKSQLSITVIANTQSDLQEYSKSVNNILSKIGIVSFIEDVNMQNAFFSTIPANFRFISRPANIPIELVAGFAYTEGNGKSASSEFMWGKVLFSLKNTNNRRFDFGLPLEQRNIMIVGQQGSGKTILSTLISLGAIKNEIGVVHITTSNKSAVCAKLSGMEIVSISADNSNAKYSKINPFFGLKPTAKHIQYTQSLIKLMSMESQDKLDSKTIEQIAGLIISSGGNLYHAITNRNIKNAIMEWMELGKFAKVFDYQSGTDSISLGANSQVIIDQSIIKSPRALSVAAFTLIFKISELIATGRDLLFIVDDVFKIFKGSIEAKLLEQVISFARSKPNVSFVFTTSCESQIIEASHAKSAVFNQIEHKIHLSNDQIDKLDGYQELFNLSKKEIEVIKAMADNYGKSFMLCTPYLREYVQFNISELGTDLRILSDASGLAMKIFDKNVDPFAFGRQGIYKSLVYELENYNENDDDIKEEIGIAA